MSFQPRIFTFYSYKGGVGRSMALLNMAYYLQARGRHVLIVDLDLEAPGASGFLHRSEELLPFESKGDVVDVLAAVVDAVKQASSAGAEPQLPALQLRDYLRSVDPKKYADAVHPKAPRARLDVLGAEQEQDYTARFSALELSSLSADQVGDASDLLRGLLIQHSFPFPQPWQEEGEAPEPTFYDYILVDSRTGLSEIGGLCVGPLSDRLIVLCGLNDQNIVGTRQFMDVVGLKPEVRPANAEAFDDADLSDEDGKRPATLGPKPTLLVASPVPGGEMMYKKKRMEVLKAQLGMTPVKLSYHPEMALMETLFVRDHSDEYLALEYATLAERLMSMVGDTAEQLIAPVMRMLAGPTNATELRTTSSVGSSLTMARANEDEVKTMSSGGGTADQLVEPMFLAPSSGEGRERKLDAAELLKRLTRSALVGSQRSIGSPSVMSRKLELSDEARAKVWRVQINLAPSEELAAQGWREWADDDQDVEQTRNTGSHEVLLAIEEKYRKAAALNPRLYQAFQNWGAALSQWADSKAGAEADALFAQAFEKYQQAEVIHPHNYEMLYNWGTALSRWAGNKTGEEADALYSQAIEKYRQAAVIQPKNQATFHNWATALSQWAGNKAGAEADALRTQSCEKYQQVAALQPHDYTTFFNWGTALLQWAKTKSGPEADTLLAQACEKYQQAMAIQPNNHAALRNWAVTLMQWARSKKGAEADALFTQGCEKYQQAAAAVPGDYANYYNWGNALSDWANTKVGVAADALYSQACEKYQQAVAIQPTDATLSNWGTALLSWAKIKTGAEAYALYAQACEKYQLAAAIKPTDDATLSNWGHALAAWANINAQPEASALLSQACEKYKQAVIIEPGEHSALFGWGNALAEWAKIKSGTEADALLAQACEKFQQAANIKPNDLATYNNWGATLSNRALAKSEAEADALFAQADEKYQQALVIQPDYSIVLYNRASLAALRGKVDDAVAALEKWKSSDPEANKAKLDDNSDFDRIRNDPRFLAFRDGLAD